MIGVLTLLKVFDLSKAALVGSGASVTNADPWLAQHRSERLSAPQPIF